MKTGLGLYRKYRICYAYLNLLRFWVRKKLLGFDIANQFLNRVDKVSLQLILKKNGATIGRDCDIETGLTFHNCKNYSNLIIGNNCHIGKNCFFDLRDKIEIKDNVVISMECAFVTHMDMNKSDLRKLFPANSQPILISNNCYIGAKSTVLMGTALGKCSFIAAASLVNKNIEPYTMVGSVPAKVIKKLNIES